MRDKPDWVKKLEAEPCQCVSCSDCGGTGTVYYDIGGNYLGRNHFEDCDDSEACYMCSGGIVEECDRCMDLTDYDYEVGLRRLWR